VKPRPLARWLFAIGAAMLWMGQAASAADVRVMISSGFYGVYEELGPAFERASGHHLVTMRGPSMGDSPEAIPARLARGEAADVVILDGGAADELGQHGLVRPDSKAELARSLIGMVVREGAPKPDISSVESPGSALPSRSRARAGRYAGLRPASRWPRWSRAARRKSDSSRSTS